MASTTPDPEKRIDADEPRDHFTLAQLPNGTEIATLETFEEYSAARSLAEDTIRRLADDE